MIGIEIPSSTDKDWNPVPGIRNPRHWIQNPRLSWNPLHGARVRFCRRGRHSQSGRSTPLSTEASIRTDVMIRPAATWATRTSRVRSPSFVKNVVRPLACVASVSNRVITRKLERKQKNGRYPPPPPSFIFCLLLSQLSRRTSQGNACYAGYKTIISWYRQAKVRRFFCICWYSRFKSS